MGVSSFAACIEPARRYRLLPYFFALQLHRCHLTRRLVEKWWRIAETESIVKAWLDTLAALPPPYRPPLARWLERSGEIGKPAPAGLDRVLCMAAAFHPPRFVAIYADDFVHELRKGTTAGFIEAWLELLCGRGFYVGLRTEAPGAEFPMARARQLALDTPQALNLAFQVCAKGPGALHLLARPELDDLTLYERIAVLGLARFAIEDAHVLLTGLAAMPQELRASFAARGISLNGVGAENIPGLLRRWNGDDALFELIKWVSYFPSPLRGALLAVPVHVARQLAKASRGLSAEARFDGGACAIEADAARAFTWLATAPAHLIDTCSWLAGYGEVRARRLLRQAAATQPLFGVMPSYDGSPDWLVRFDRLLGSHAALARRLPEFTTWEKHFSGVKVLKPVSIEDVARRLAAQVPLLQMWWLQAEIKRALALHPEEHASLFHAMLRENRRPLTRFLREHDARRDSRLDHPANRQWLARHSASFDVDAWLHRPPRLAEGAFTLAVERDPLEILKIGSYVGSCLALGGFNAHAAVAILLDVNKRVVFARNPRGRFVARQVIAISDDGKLVCYAVYTHDRAPGIEDAFERYATAWASQLGLPLAKGEDDVSCERVRPLTVKSWYDDGLWDRFCA